MSRSSLHSAAEGRHASPTTAGPAHTHPAESHGSGLPRIGTFTRAFPSHESIAHDLSGDLKARRSAASYDYLAGEGDEQRPPNTSEKFSYHMTKRPSGRRSYDYLDEDQNRAPPVPRASTGSVSNRGATTYFDSDTDDEMDFVDHQIRILEAKKARHGVCRIGNPGPIGMFAFGMTAIAFNLYNTKVFDAFSVVPALGICFGGGTEMIMGIIEWVKGNSFAYVVFVGYGAFWISIFCIWLLPNASNGGTPEIAAPSTYFIGVFYLLWALFSLILTLSALRMNVAIFLVFLTATLMFFLLAGGSMADNRTAVKAGGYVGIVCGSLAMYLGVAEVLNEVWDRMMLPVVPMTQVLGWLGANKAEKEDEEKEEETDTEDHHDIDGTGNEAHHLKSHHGSEK